MRSLVVQGRPPARRGDGPEADDALDNIDNSMWGLIEKCWSREVGDRPTCEQLLEQLELEGLASAEPEGEAQAKSLQEKQYLGVLFGNNWDIQIDMAMVRKVLAEVRYLLWFLNSGPFIRDFVALS